MGRLRICSEESMPVNGMTYINILHCIHHTRRKRKSCPWKTQRVLIAQGFLHRGTRDILPHFASLFHKRHHLDGPVLYFLHPSRPLAVSVPGSKSITNRALLLATLAQGTSTLRGVLFSDDSGRRRCGGIVDR